MSFPGTKLSYIQGVATYDVLDCFFDHYVCASEFVRDHVRRLYGLDAPVIPPFVHVELVPEPVPWDQRPPRKVLVLRKSHSAPLLEHIQSVLRQRHSSLGLEFEPVHAVVPQRDLLCMMQKYRYVLSLSACEGFGLCPLEAMLCGCSVVGFHGHGGLQYMVSAKNCEVVAYPAFDALVDLLARVVRDDELARALAGEGRRTALGFGLPQFRERWTSFFQDRMKFATTAPSPPTHYEQRG
ncbi:MAG: glycosyltransferase [Candidatus Eiseniibacteriota bacterium]